jgi:hypothetical protein
MLFLLNDKVIEITAPEAHLMQRWRDIGCGDPRVLRAQSAVEFAVQHFSSHHATSGSDTFLIEKDIAALIIAKTGANSLILKPSPAGGFEPRLRDVPYLVLETYQRGAANDRDERARA